MFRLTVANCVRPVALLSLLSQAVLAASLSGVVKDGSGGAAAGATVQITSVVGGEPRSTLSDANGSFSFDGIAAGTYKMAISLPGFNEYSKASLTVSDQPGTPLAVTLVPANKVESVDVHETIDPFQVVPDTPTDSVFGLDLPLAETPRSISSVTSELMTRYDVKSVNDLVSIVPGSFTGSYFGVPGALFLRGEAADNFYRGFRRVENRGNYKTPIDDAQELEVVKGPPPPIYGGGKVSGYVNYIPKSVRSTTAKWLEHPTGQLTLTYGSYDQKVGSLEFGSPFKIGQYRAGFYSYFSAEDSLSYYKGISTRDKIGQISFDMELPHKFRLEFGMQGFYGALPQNIGWNRVTQDLIDKGSYLSGQPATNLAAGSYSLNPSNFSPGELLNFAYAANYAPIFLASSQAPLFALNPATVKLVHLNNNQIFVDTGDFSDATTYTGYFDLVRDIREGFTIKNQTFFDSLDHQKFSSYGFGANYTPQVVENKTSIDYAFTPARWIRLQTTSGFSYRYTDVTAGEERTYAQVIDRRDISVGATPNDRFAGVFSTQGQWGFNYLQKGSYGDAGVFGLANIVLFDRLSVMQGVRYDHYNTSFLGQDNGEGLSRAVSKDGVTTYNTSVSYRLPFHIVPYATAASARYLDLGQGGEIDNSEIANHTYIQPATIYEGGVKASSFNDRLYGSVAYFHQRHSSYNSLSRQIDYFRGRGVESELRAAITKKVSVTGAFTWQDPEQLNIPFLLGIPPQALGLTPEQGYGGRFIGTADIFGIKAPVKVAGQPPYVVSIFGTVTPKRWFGFTMGNTWIDKVKAGYVTPLHLPSYGVWRGSVFVSHKNYSLSLATNNFTDTNYFNSQFLFWDVFVKPSEMRTLTSTLTYRF